MASLGPFVCDPVLGAWSQVERVFHALVQRCPARGDEGANVLQDPWVPWPSRYLRQGFSVHQ